MTSLCGYFLFITFLAACACSELEMKAVCGPLFPVLRNSAFSFRGKRNRNWEHTARKGGGKPWFSCDLKLEPEPRCFGASSPREPSHNETYGVTLRELQSLLKLQLLDPKDGSWSPKKANLQLLVRLYPCYPHLSSRVPREDPDFIFCFACLGSPSGKPVCV